MSKAGKSHKKQHFVPQCYTKAWHDLTAPAKPANTPYVWLFDKDGSNPRRKAPVNIFKETDIYTITRADGYRGLQLEHGFQELEDKFTRIRNLKFNRRLWPDAQELVWLLAFVAAAQVRTASHRDFHREQWASVRKRMEDMQAEINKASPEGRESMAQISRTSLGVRSGKGIGVEDIRRLESHPIQEMTGPALRRIVPVLKKMRLNVLCADDPLGFITTDSPCTWFDPEAYKLHPLFRSTRLASSTIEITLPISPKQCLAFTHSPLPSGYIDVNPHTVDILNHRHIAHCDQSFISHSEITRPTWFEQRPMPDDAWEKVCERNFAAGELGD